MGKSRCVRQALTGRCCWIGGQATPLGIYLQAYQHRHQPIVLDDVDGLYADRHGIGLLNALAQTEKTRVLSWHTNTSILAGQDIPSHLLVFEPTPWEVHQQAARWFWDAEIFDFVADHLHLIEQHSLRTYGHAWELKQAGLEWKRAVLSRYLSGAALEVAKLKANPAFASEAERVKAFIESGAGCRATYFNQARKLQPEESRPKITLTRTVPPADPQGDFYDRLRRRFGELGNG